MDLIDRNNSNEVPSAEPSQARMSAAKTMKLIAERAGCAVSTVSRVINGNRKNFSVRPALEEKILSLARELDYRPNPFLQSMRTNETKIVVIFDPILGFSDFQQDAKRGFLDEIRNAGYIAVGSYVQIYRLHEYTVPFPIVGSLLFDISDLSFLSFFEKKKIPYVVLNGLCLDGGAAVQIDEATNAKMLIKHLYDFGHRKITYYGEHSDAGTPGQHYSGILREKCFLDELSRHNLKHPDRNGNAIPAPALFLKYHVLEHDVTAVVCYDHIRVQKLLNAAWQLNIKVPEQLSIVCFNDDNSLVQSTPPVSCCNFNGYDVGLAAGRLLLEKLNTGNHSSENVLRISGQLMKRESVNKIHTTGIPEKLMDKKTKLKTEKQ